MTTAASTTSSTRPLSGPRRERISVVLLLLSTALAASIFLAILAPVAWLPGMVLLGLSHRWSGADKVLGFLTYGVGGLVVPIILIFGPLLTWVSGRNLRCPDSGVATTACASGASLGVWVSFLACTVIFVFQLWTAWRLWRAAR